MPPLPPVPGVIKVFLLGNVDNQNVDNWGNQLHFRYSGSPPASTDCQTLSFTIQQSWATYIAPLLPSPGKLEQVTVTDLTSNSAGEGETVGPVPGTRGDDSIPANACLLIRYPVTVRYRGGHPRTYLFAGGNADLQGATNWSTLFTSEAQGQWRNFLGAIIGRAFGPATVQSLCAVSYYQGTDPATGKPLRRATPLVLTLNAAAAVAEQEMASQRRRIGRGRRAR